VIVEISDIQGQLITMRYYHEEGDYILLLPDNPDYRPQILPKHKVRIIGIVLKSIRIFNHLKNQTRINYRKSDFA